MEYNTARDLLVMKEYGRHIQHMVDYVVAIPEKDKRQEQAQILIELMGFLNPHLKNVEDFRHKLWDHLFYMSDFKLDVDSPYPIPTKENYKEKPAPLPYPNQHPKHAHLGRNLDTLIDNAIEEKDEQKKDMLISAILYYIKLAYATWHKEQVSDESILQELKHISKGRLVVDELPQFKYKPSTTENKEDKKGNNKRQLATSYSAKNNGRTSNSNGNRNGNNGNSYNKLNNKGKNNGGNGGGRGFASNGGNGTKKWFK